MTDVSPNTTQASPSSITESDVRSFFERLTTHFVSMSAQAKDLADIKDQVAYLTMKLQNAQDDNSRIRKEINDTYDLMKQVEQERDQAKSEVEEARSTVARLTDNVNDRDRTISELRAQVENQRNAIFDRDAIVSKQENEIRNLTNDRDYWQTQVKATDGENRDLRINLEDTRSTRDKLQTEVSRLTLKLSQFRALLDADEDKPKPAEPVAYNAI